MSLAEDLWLRGRAAQTSMMHVMAYNAAVASTATLQAWKLGLTAHRGFWSAMGRAGGLADDAGSVGAGPVVAVAADAGRRADPTHVHGFADLPDASAGDAPSSAPEARPGLPLLEAPRNGRGDDLTSLRGIGPKLSAALNACGIFHFDQLADLDAEGIGMLDARQPGFRMICARHDIVAQAKARLT
jgi:predicted flap endonuclease-1-like 5' DNA nuclease